MGKGHGVHKVLLEGGFRGSLHFFDEIDNLFDFPAGGFV